MRERAMVDEIVRRIQEEDMAADTLKKQKQVCVCVCVCMCVTVCVCVDGYVHPHLP